MIRVVNSSFNPYFNLALEEYLLKEKDLGEDIFMLWQNSPAVIVGRNQNTWDEINHPFIKENKIAVVRRLTGGGAVYHDPGNLNFTFIARGQRNSHYDFAGFAGPVVAALKSLGVAAEFAGRNDILVAGKKVSGNAQYRYGNSVLHHGTLLFDTDMKSLVQALQVSTNKLLSKGVASVRSRVTNIREHLPVPMEIRNFQSALVEFIFREADQEYKEYGLSRSDLSRVEELVRTKYETWQWNYGASPGYGLRKKMRFEWGKVEVFLDLKDDKIASCKIYGDFFGQKDIGDLEKQFVHLPLEKSALEQALDGIDLSAYINGLDRDSMVELLTG